MLVDLLLAIGHHLLIFALLGVLVMEMMILRPEMSPAAVLRVGRIDSIYGVLAGLILIVGFSRVFFGIKGSAFYLGNPVFWAKIAAFAAVGLLSIPPTIRMIGWRRQAERSPGFVPAAADVQNVKRFMHLEGFVFILIPVFAAMMARGYGN
jgi:putative membrane protein